MNRKAKRNKYKKLQIKLQNEIDFWKRKQQIDAFIENSQRREIRTVSVMYNPLGADRFLGNIEPDTNIVMAVNRMAEEILKHKEFIKVTDAGFGYRYDLFIVKVEYGSCNEALYDCYGYNGKLLLFYAIQTISSK